MHTLDSFKPRTLPSSKIRILPGLVAAAALLFALYGLMPARMAMPRQIADRVTGVRCAQSADGAWYWLEQRGGQCAIVKTDGRGNTVIATEPAILDLSVDQSQSAWIALSVGQASIRSCAGSTPTTLCPAAPTARSLCLRNGIVYWAEQQPEMLSGIQALPSIGIQTVIKAISVSGGSSSTVGSLLEAGDVKIVGLSGDKLVVMCTRSGMRGVSALYLMPTKGGEPARVAAAVGTQHATVTRHGKAYYTTAGRDTSNPALLAAINALNADGSSSPLSDWLPANGEIYAANNQLLYLDGSVYPALWKPGSERSLPEKLTVPAGYTPLAVGDIGGPKVLLRPDFAISGTYPLYEVRLPE